jgi:hypothetical protein
LNKVDLILLLQINTDKYFSEIVEKRFLNFLVGVIISLTVLTQNGNSITFLIHIISVNKQAGNSLHNLFPNGPRPGPKGPKQKLKHQLRVMFQMIDGEGVLNPMK